MPVVELSYAALQKMTGRPRKEVAEALPYLGLDIESEDGDMVRVEYSPNRPDYSTEYGVALGLRGALGVEEGMVRIPVSDSERRITAKPAVSQARPYITAIAATGGMADDRMIKQLMALQEDLHDGMGRNRVKASVGLHDLSKVKFPLTYGSATRSYAFEPLGHQKMTIGGIMDDTDVGREYGYMLGNRARVPLLIDADDRPVSLPPVINAARTALAPGATGILAEVTGLSKKVIEEVLAVIAVTLHAAGFSLESVHISGVRNTTPALSPRRMKVSSEMVNRALGLDLPAGQVVSCLRRSRLDASASGRSIECTVPAYRFDMFGSMDIVEEAALGYGIGRLEPGLRASAEVGSVDDMTAHLGRVAHMMTGLGYVEALSPSLTSPEMLYDMMGLEREGVISVIDSKSSDHSALRGSLLPGLLGCLSRNVHEQYPQRIFETGPVFWRDGAVKEGERLCCITSHGGASYTEAKSVLQAAVSGVYGTMCTTRAAAAPGMAKGRSAEIMLEGEARGHIGEVSQAVLDGFGLREPAAAFEMDIRS